MRLRASVHPWPRAARKGIAAAELAILLPFVALMFVAAVDFSRVYYCTQVAEEAARSGALYASGVARRDKGSKTAVQAAKDAAVAAGTSLSPPLTESDVTVSISGGVASVTVTYQASMFTSYPGLPSKVSVKRTVQMRVSPTAVGEN
jgi:Flp pilus assembly protein TadG